MALLLTEADVKGLLTMPMALTAVEESFRRLASGSAIVHPRQRLHIPGKAICIIWPLPMRRAVTWV